MNMSKIALVSGVGLVALFGSIATADDSGLSPNDFSEATKGLHEKYHLTIEPSDVSRAEPSSEGAFAGIDGSNIFEYLRALTDISLESKANGDVLWGRVQGGPYERKASEYVKAKFDEWNLENVRLEEFPLSRGVWEPSAVSTSVRVGKEHIELTSAATAYASGTTPKGGLSLPIEYVGLGSPTELRGKDLEGKVALLYVRVFDGVLMHTGLAAANRIANETEAAGIVLWMDLPGNAQHATQLWAGDGWVDSVPWVSIGFEDGAYLRQIIDQSETPPTVSLVVEGEFRTEGTSQNVIAELPGTTDENLIVTAHIDGFWEAVLDNGTGVAALMEMARYYASVPQKERKRNLIFVVAGDHETSGHGGSLVYAQRHPEVVARTALVVQLEHLGSPDFSNSLNTLQVTNVQSALKPFVSHGNHEVVQALSDTVSRYGLVVPNQVVTATMGDVDGFKEVPSVGFIQTGQLYHSTMDGLHWYKPEHLERLTRAHAYLLSELNQHSFTELRQKSVSGDLPAPYSSPDLLGLWRPW